MRQREVDESGRFVISKDITILRIVAYLHGK